VLQRNWYEYISGQKNAIVLIEQSHEMKGSKSIILTDYLFNNDIFIKLSHAKD